MAHTFSLSRNRQTSEFKTSLDYRASSWLANAACTVRPNLKNKVLILDLTTGFNHSQILKAERFSVGSYRVEGTSVRTDCIKEQWVLVIKHKIKRTQLFSI